MRNWFSVLTVVGAVGAIGEIGLLALPLACAARPEGTSRTKGAGAAVAVKGRGGDFRQVAIVGADGRSAIFSGLLGERPALVTFWAPWCEPCVKELPNVERLSRQMAACGVAVLGVAVGEAPATIAAFARARQLTYPQFVDEDFHLADAMGQTRVPTTVVFDRAHHVIFVGEGLDRRAVAALRSTLDAGAGSPDCAQRDPF